MSTQDRQSNPSRPLQRRRRHLNEVFEDFDARGVGLRMSDNLTREELYDRDRAREEAEKERSTSDPGAGSRG